MVELVVLDIAPELAGAPLSGEVMAPGAPEVAGVVDSVVVVLVVSVELGAAALLREHADSEAAAASAAPSTMAV